jgi:hypothetical protein
MTAPLRSRLVSPFRATNWACGPVEDGKNWSRFGPMSGRKCTFRSLIAINRLATSSLGAVTVRERSFPPNVNAHHKQRLPDFRECTIMFSLSWSSRPPGPLLRGDDDRARGLKPPKDRGSRLPRPSKSLTLRVAKVRSSSNAVAAIRPSMLGSGVPLSRAWAERTPRLEEGVLQTTAQDRAPTTPPTRCAVGRR